MTEKKITQETKPSLSSKLFTSDGKPIKALSTSLGIALLANAALSTGVAASAGSSGGDEPKLVAWSSEEVKQYFDANIDWSIPLPESGGEEEPGDGAGSGTGDSSEGTTVNHYHSGLGWNQLLLYHLLFNRGGTYSSTGYYNNRPATYSGTNTAYKPRTHSGGDFQNKPVAGTTVRPKTSTSTGSITRRSTTASAGSIGGKSSGMSSSSSSTSTKSSSGFGG